jgi:hypothetical protein
MANQNDDFEDGGIDDWEDVANDDWESVSVAQHPVLAAQEKYVGPVRDLGKSVLGAVGNVAEFVDRYAQAPIRAGIGRVMDYAPAQDLQTGGRSSLGSQFIRGYTEQFGEPAAKAPSGKELFSAAGVSNREFSTGLKLNPYTGETLKTSLAGILGGVGEAVADPLAIVTAEGLTPFKIASSAARGVGDATKWGTKKAARGLFGIPEQATEDLIARSARVNQVGRTLPAEEIGLQIDEAVKAAGSDIASATDKRKALQEYLKNLYQEKKRSLEREQVPLEIVRKAKGNLEQQKATIGKLSELADEALVNSGVSYRKSDLLNIIRQARDSIIEIPVGKETKSALNDINAIIQDIDENIGDRLSARQLRIILKNLRRDTNFDYAAGAYNETADVIIKYFKIKMSDSLKGKITESGQKNPYLERYSQIMDQMAPMQESLKETSKLFGGSDETRGIGTLDTLRKGGGAKGVMLDEQLRKNASIGNNQDLIELLDRYKSQSELLQRMKDKDISSEIFPEDYKALQEALVDEQMVKSALNPTQNITPRRTQSIIRRQGQKTAPWTDRKDLQVLSDYSGDDFNELIKSRNTYDAFDKDAARGSRLTLLGTAVGGYLGDTFGGAVGGGLGSMADRFGPPITRSAISGVMAGKNAIQKIFQLAGNNPVFQSKYGKIFGQAIDRGGYPAAELYHNLLMNNDPEYRAYFQEAQQ